MILIQEWDMVDLHDKLDNYMLDIHMLDNYMLDNYIFDGKKNLSPGFGWVGLTKWPLF